MKLSLNWLRRYLPELPHNLEKISEELTRLGFEVEGIHQLGEPYQKLVVGKVLECNKHPEADKLSITKLFDGTQELQVVCGAPNVAAGQTVVFAPIGAELPLPDGTSLKLKKAKIRGIESFGMICAEDEIGLGNSHAGIMTLDDSINAGTSILSLGFYDTVIEIDVTPNRPDVLNHIGAARELAAAFGLTLKMPTFELKETGKATSNQIQIHLEENCGCSYYSARIIEGVKVAESPLWLKSYLNTIGVRPINNVVDITNFVLMELGQPLHAFDLDQWTTHNIQLRKTKNEGEKFVTLDGVERSLDQNELVVCDGDRPVCLAGVMGGQNTEVSENTTRILLECAYFEPSVVRKQSRRLGLMSDSSYRFERGIDPLNQAFVSDYAATLIAQICGGEILHGRVEAKTAQHPSQGKLVELRTEKVESLLGIDISASEISKLLLSIELKLNAKDSESQTFEIPGWRPDLTREVDLIEEVARLYGYNAIPVQYPSFEIRPTPLTKQEEVARKARYFLATRGLCEAMSLRFQSIQEVKNIFGTEDIRSNGIILQNPLSEALAVMPTSAIPSLVRSADHNFRNLATTQVRLFEISKAFFPTPELLSKTHPGVREQQLLSGIWAGDLDFIQGQTKATSVHLLNVKQILTDLFSHLNLNVIESRPEQGQAFLHPARQIEYTLNGKFLGFIGELHPATQKQADLSKNAIVFELDFDLIVALALGQREFKMFSRFGKITRDISLLVPSQLDQKTVLAKIANIGAKNKTEVNWISSYEGTGVPEGQKNLVFQVVYQSTQETLTDEVVQKAHDKLLIKLGEDQEISIR